MSKYVDKDKVLEYIIFGVVGKDITCGELIRAIESIPTIEVSERTGEWVKNENSTYTCDKCQSWIPEEQYHYANYCPHCGAKMDKE